MNHPFLILTLVIALFSLGACTSAQPSRNAGSAQSEGSRDSGGSGY
ncbi:MULTISPECIES: hypothetical protein [unclassified Ensifer]|nr:MULTISPECIES: hypothetical protein [unclassified Ensifer]